MVLILPPSWPQPFPPWYSLQSFLSPLQPKKSASGSDAKIYHSGQWSARCLQELFIKSPVSLVLDSSSLQTAACRPDPAQQFYRSGCSIAGAKAFHSAPQPLLLILSEPHTRQPLPLGNQGAEPTELTGSRSYCLA